MKRLLVSLAVVSAVAAASPAFAALSNGAAAPDFSAKSYLAGKPEQFSLKTALKKGPVVLYFFPGAYTPGCNIEAKAFADAADKFKAAGATVVGITGGFGTADRQGPPAASLDEAVKDFSSTHCNGKFPVALASADVIKAYDSVLTQKPEWSNRTSYVITPDGKVAASYVNLKADGHVETTLKAVEDYKAAHKKG